MQKLVIEAWQRVPYAAGEEPGMPTWRVAFTAPAPALLPGKARCGIADVSMEIDGRDGDYEHVAGYNPMVTLGEADGWEAIVLALSECDTLQADMQAETDRYYAS